MSTAAKVIVPIDGLTEKLSVLEERGVRIHSVVVAAQPGHATITVAQPPSQPSTAGELLASLPDLRGAYPTERLSDQPAVMLSRWARFKEYGPARSGPFGETPQRKEVMVITGTPSGPHHVTPGAVGPYLAQARLDPRGAGKVTVTLACITGELSSTLTVTRAGRDWQVVDYAPDGRLSWGRADTLWHAVAQALNPDLNPDEQDSLDAGDYLEDDFACEVAALALTALTGHRLDVLAERT